MSQNSLASRALRGAAPLRFGCEKPRVFTPPLRLLSAKTSLGFSVIEFATDVLLIELLPWQRWLLIHALELLPDGTFRFRNVVVLVARQNGKSTLSQIIALWFMYVYGFALVLGTAQDLDTAEEVWQGAVDLVQEVDENDQPLRPELFGLLDRVIMVNGKKTLQLSTGQRYKVKAASRRAGRGLSGDLILLDELREHQSWDAWGAITKTTMAREEAQIWALSNAGDAASIVLHYLRKMGHVSAGDPDQLNAGALAVELDDDLAVDGDDLGIFEWSAPPGCDVSDRDGWAQANPSMGYTISERTIASAMRTDPEPVFRTEVLCQWVATLEDLPIDPGQWESVVDVESSMVSVSAFAIDVSRDREWASIGAAGPRSDGLVHVELTTRDGVPDHRQGTQWLVQRCTELNQRWSPAAFIIDSSGPASSLISDFEDAGLPVHSTTTGDVADAYASTIDAIRQRTLRHGPQIELQRAVLSARKRPIGDGLYAFGRRASGTDITPLVAVALAAWGHNQFGAVSAAAYVI